MHSRTTKIWLRLENLNDFLKQIYDFAPYGRKIAYLFHNIVNKTIIKVVIDIPHTGHTDENLESSAAAPSGVAAQSGKKTPFSGSNAKSSD